LANQLNYGSLPITFELRSQEEISATLGTEQLERGILAGLIGLGLVVVYSVAQYRGLALVTLLSLTVAGALTYGSITALSELIGYRLSLAGVAGLIIAIGITAASFIVYFERIRDEVREGRRLEDAVELGWARARRTILASDAVNLLAAVVLYTLAVGGVRGFAFTLGLTTVIDVLVVILFTHPMVQPWCAPSSSVTGTGSPVWTRCTWVPRCRSTAAAGGCARASRSPNGAGPPSLPPLRPATRTRGSPQVPTTQTHRA